MNKRRRYKAKRRRRFKGAINILDRKGLQSISDKDYRELLERYRRYCRMYGQPDGY